MTTTTQSRANAASARSTSSASLGATARTRPRRGRKHHQGSVEHPRDTRLKRTLFTIAGIGSALIFGVPLLVAILRAFQPNAVIVAAPTWTTFWSFGVQNFESIFNPSQHLLTGLVNSLIVAITAAVVTAIVATLPPSLD